jgi:hypothetical protein
MEGPLFTPGTRVEHAQSPHKGTVKSDDGQYVVVEWDDKKTGILSYNRAVWFNAHNLIALKQ